MDCASTPSTGAAAAELEVDGADHAGHRLADGRRRGLAAGVGVDDQIDAVERLTRRRRPAATALAEARRDDDDGIEVAVAHRRLGSRLDRARRSARGCVVRATAVRAAAPAPGVPSWSTQPTLYCGASPPEKMDPNRTTKMTGKASVQKSAARSRTKLLRLASGEHPQGAHRSRQSRSARPVRSRKTSSSVGRRTSRFVRLDAERLGGRQQRRRWCRHVARVEDDLAALVGHAA